MRTYRPWPTFLANAVAMITIREMADLARAGVEAAQTAAGRFSCLCVADAADERICWAPPGLS
jgi:hypothetical protein